MLDRNTFWLTLHKAVKNNTNNLNQEYYEGLFITFEVDKYKNYSFYSAAYFWNFQVNTHKKELLEVYKNFLINDSKVNIKKNKDFIFKYIYENLNGYRVIEELLLDRNIFSMSEWLEFVKAERELEKAFANIQNMSDKELYKVNI